MLFFYVAGYVCGENIYFTITIHNQSSNDIEDLKVFLKCDISFHASSKTRSLNNNYEEIPCPFVVRSNELRVWKGVIKIPLAHISLNSSMNNSKIININYSLALKANVSTFSISKVVQVPIVIGTVMFEESTYTNNHPAFQAQVDQIADNFSGNYNPIANYPTNIFQSQNSELPPPYNNL